MNKKLIIFIAVLILVLVGIKIASANSSYFVQSTYMTTTATTTLTQVFPGQATTTFLYDSYSGSIPQPADSATLLLQQTASSAPAVLTIGFEYSQDGSDWYGDSLNMATTSANVSLSVNKSYTWQASSTSVSKKAIKFDVPTRYVRATFSAASATTSVWAQVVPLREVRE